MVRTIAPEFAAKQDPKVLRWGIYVFVFVTSVAVAVANPSILDLISVVGGVFIAFLLYIVPMLLYRNAIAYKHYANRVETWFVFLMGIVIICVAVWQIFA